MPGTPSSQPPPAGGGGAFISVLKPPPLEGGGWRRGRRTRVFLLCYIAILFLTTPLHADPKPIAADGVWGTPSSGNPSQSLIYLTLSLAHGATDQLLGASTPLAGSVELAAPQSNARDAKMAALDSISLDSAEPFVFQPQGPHLILRDVRQPLVVGDVFPLLLDFAKAGKVEISVTITRGNPAAGMPRLPKGLKLE